MNEIPLKLKIAAELELRRREKEELIHELLDTGSNGFIRFMEMMLESRDGETFIEGPHHRMIADKLMEVYEGKVTRLIINMPPGFGKTEEVVIMFTAWCMAKSPRSRFMHITYSDDLCTRNSRFIKSTIQCEKYKELFGYEFEKDNNSASRWGTEQGAEFYAAASGGQLTGFRAGRFGKSFTGAMIVDDPIKPDDAQSETMRNDINSRIERTIRSRLAVPATPIIVVMQRVHDVDPCGYLLGLDNGEKWDILSLPVIKDGIPLWPEKMGVDDIEIIRRSDKRVFASQYMQNPTPDDGDYFQRQYARYYSQLPQNLTFYGASDYAVSEGKGDFTEHGIFGLDHKGNLYIADWWTGQTTPDQWIKTQLALAKKWNVKLWTAEVGGIRNAVEPYLRRSMFEQKHMMVLEWLSHGGKDKTANARSFQALWQDGRIYLPKDQPWAEDIIAQMLRFPNGKNDDKVDVLGLVGRLMDKIWTNTPIRHEQKPNLPHNVYIIGNPWDPIKKKRSR